MKPENLALAIKICAEHHSTKLSLNHIRHNNNSVSAAIPLVIHECCASVVDKLIKEKFSLSMGPEGLHVDDYCRE